MSSPAACPFCGAPLAADQSWCVECGAAARTRLAPTPRRWRTAAAVLLLASVLAVAAIALAVAMLIRPG